MANRFRQVRLLLWKNFVLQIRRPIGTVFEIILPILLVSALIIPKVYIKPYKVCFSAPRVGFSSQNMREWQSGYLTYYPLKDPVASLMSNVSSLTGVKITNVSIINGKPFSSLNQMVEEVAKNTDKYEGVMVFDLKEGEPLPKKVKYTIRLPSINGMNWKTERTYSSDGYTDWSIDSYRSKFLPLQYATDMTIIQRQSSTPTFIPIQTQEFPYPGYINNIFVSFMSVFAPLLITLAFIYSAVSTIKEIVLEKQQRLKESMKMMGLDNWVHWLAWFIKCLLFWSISVVLATIIIKAFKIFEYSNGFLLLVFLLLYAATSISYCFFISVFFTNPTLSMLIGLVLWYVTLIPYQVLAQSDSFGEQRKEKFDLLSKGAKLAMCLLPNSAFGIGATIFLRLESLRIGMTFETINRPTSPDDDLTLAWVMLMMVISIVIFVTLTWYIEGVFPGKYGIPKPFYFPFQKSYWCGFSHDDVIEANALNDGLGADKSQNPTVEDEPSELEIGVGIKDLTKVFKSSDGTKVAVDGLSLNMYKGQITALLGHNGAGKTTTMSILTGLFPPTSGSAHVGNKSILTDIDGIRESLGLCPQHNVLFDRLTVKEHLEFFVNLKGKYGQEAKDEVLAMITDMQLLDKTNAKASTLSGGMKRKLSCAIALVGGSETVFLDEPTSGMDPYARRATWDLLLKYKAGKTIILTTHFMDEADFLGDRIAIMADGQLRCCGSSLFLKSRYGVGYHLTLVKDRTFNENMTIDTVKRFVPSAEILSNVGAELEMVLNKDAADSFESLFLDLESKKQEYGIASFGVSVTTMEEVFMKVGEGAEKTVDDMISDHEQHRRGDTENLVNMPSNHAPDMGELQTGLAHKWQQYKAMLTKRFLNSKRDKKAVLTQLILPCAFVVIGLITLINLNSDEGNDPPRLLKLSNLSIGGVNSKAFFGYFHDQSASTKASYLSTAKDYLSTVKVDTIDVTGEVNTIQTKNALGIDVRGKYYNYTSPVEGRISPCCNYEFLILNAKCKNDFLEKRISAQQCRSNEKFGYVKACGDGCLLKRDFSGFCLSRQLTDTGLKYEDTFFSEYVLEKSDAKDYFMKHVAGFTINSISTKGSPTKIPFNPSTVWYSKNGLHTIADAMSAMTNIFLRKATGSKDYEIETTNFPLPKVASKQSEDDGGGTISVYSLIIFFSLGLACVAASFTSFIVQERTSKAKHLQFVSGVDSFCYWFGTYTWDFLNYLIPATLILIIFAAFQIESYKDEMGAVFLLLLLFGFAVLPSVYIISFIFKSSLIAYAVISILLTIIAMVRLSATNNMKSNKFKVQNVAIPEYLQYSHRTKTGQR